MMENHDLGPHLQNYFASCICLYNGRIKMKSKYLQSFVLK